VATKGAFAFSTSNRKTWSADGPHFPCQEVNHISKYPRQPKRLYAAVNSVWFGPRIHASTRGVAARGILVALRSIYNSWWDSLS
jgi:hypothetical protein